jgi:hemerythrin-like domain-containing protein
MQTKPIKRNEHIVKLSRDHHAGLLFCWKLRQGVKYHIAAERLITYIQYFWQHHFSIHFKEEEEILFSPLKDGIVEKAMAEHQNIKTFIDQISLHGTEVDKEVVLQLADMVNDHIRFEERVLFPHLEEKLPDEQLKKIGKEINTEPLMDNFEDNFWTKPASL